MCARPSHSSSRCGSSAFSGLSSCIFYLCPAPYALFQTRSPDAGIPHPAGPCSHVIHHSRPPPHLRPFYASFKSGLQTSM